MKPEPTQADKNLAVTLHATCLQDAAEKSGNKISVSLGLDTHFDNCDWCKETASELAAVRTETEKEMVERCAEIVDECYEKRHTMFKDDMLALITRRIRALSPDPDWRKNLIAEATKPLREALVIANKSMSWAKKHYKIDTVDWDMTINTVHSAVCQALKETEGGSHAPSVPRDT